MPWRIFLPAANQRRASARCRSSTWRGTTWLRTAVLCWLDTRTCGSFTSPTTSCSLSLPGVVLWLSCQSVKVLLKNFILNRYLRYYLCRIWLPNNIYNWNILPVCLSKLSKLEQLEELNLSGNKLKTIPSTVSSCKRLHTLIAHSNHITVFPEILNLPEIKVSLTFVFIFLSSRIILQWLCLARDRSCVFRTFVACRS